MGWWYPEGPSNVGWLGRMWLVLLGLGKHRLFYHLLSSFFTMNKWSYRPTSSLRGEDWLTKIPRLYLYYYLILPIPYFICLAFHYTNHSTSGLNDNLFDFMDLVCEDTDKCECCLILSRSGLQTVLYMMFFTRRSTYYCCRNRPPQLKTSGTSLITFSSIVYVVPRISLTSSLLGCRVRWSMALVDTI